MKKLFCPLFLLAFSSGLHAQTIDAANFTPVIGESIDFFAGDSLFSTGGTGANQTWNYQTLTGTPSGTAVYLAVAGGNASASYGDATFRIRFTNGPTDAYYFAYQAGVKYLGNGGVGGNGVRYSNPFYQYRYPMSLNTTFSEIKNTQRLDLLSGNRDTLKGLSTVTVTASGTLVLPSGIFHNVLKLVRTDQDTVYYNGGMRSVLRTVTTEWLCPGIHVPLLTNTISENLSVPGLKYGASQFTNKSPLAINEVVKQQYKCAVYPNPAAGQLNVQMELPVRADVAVQLFTLNGQLVRAAAPQSLEKGKQTLTISVEGLAAGTYLIDATVSGVHIYQTFVKQ